MTQASAMMMSAFLIAVALNAEPPSAAEAVLLVGGARLKMGFFMEEWGAVKH